MNQMTGPAPAGVETDVHTLIDVVLELSDDPEGTRRRFKEWAKAEIRGTERLSSPAVVAAPLARRGPGRPRIHAVEPAVASPPPPPSSEVASPVSTTTVSIEVDLGNFVVFRGEKWLDSSGAAAFLKLSRKTLANWRTRNSALPKHQWIGPSYQTLVGKPRYRLADLEAWLAKDVV